MRRSLVLLSHSSARRRAHGFTFIELMLIIGLLGVLVAIALPSYASYRDKARQRQAATEITTMSATLKLRWDDERAYPASLAAAGMSGRLDPWGRPYVYYNVDANGIGGARKDHALNPINTDFDLYSLGPDGATQKQVTQKDSVDDVIRANNGAFVGVAADF
jgi:general secretion pathway protein G